MDLKELEEKFSKDKPTFSLLELVICSALVVAGCAIFSFMPDEMGIWGWVLFAVGTLLNVIGIFRLAAMIPSEKDEPGWKIAAIISIILAVFMLISEVSIV